MAEPFHDLIIGQVCRFLHVGHYIVILSWESIKEQADLESPPALLRILMLDIFELTPEVLQFL